MGVFLPSSALPGLKQYRYSGQDHSPISKYILKPFYQKFVLIFPTWLAPNLVTLLGFGFVLINVATMLYYNPSFSVQCPTWVYISYAIGLFFYQTFDACDGLQARRTGQSGPLGELFDHCVDALNTTLEVLLFASVANMGYGWYVILSQFGTLCNFYLSTWEEYHTGTLYLSTFSGPVEGILMVIGLYLITAYLGTEIWSKPIVDQLGINISGAQSWFYKLSYTDVYMIFAGFALTMNVYQSAENVIKSIAEHKRNGRTSSFRSAVLGLMPFVGFYISLFVWIWLSPSLLYEHLLPLTAATGIAFAFTVGRVILAHVTKQEFPIWNPLLALPSIGILNVFLGRLMGWDAEFTSICSVWAGLGFSLGIYSLFIAEIVQEITAYLDIGCLYIKYPLNSNKDK